MELQLQSPSLCGTGPFLGPAPHFIFVIIHSCSSSGPSKALKLRSHSVWLCSCWGTVLICPSKGHARQP